MARSTRTNVAGDIIGDFGGSDMAIGATYARKLSPQLARGGTAKFIYQKIDQYSSTGLAVDAGLLYPPQGRQNESRSICFKSRRSALRFVAGT